MEQNMSKLIDITGKKFGKLTVLEKCNTYTKRKYWKCICDCGKETIKESYPLRNGLVRSCGCLYEEFISNTKIEWDVNENGCFICTSHIGSKGYPHYNWDGKESLMSRFIWEQMFGEIPSKMFICHKCDNPACINPEHLFLGTPKSNSEDMVKKNRQWKPIGDKHHNKKLSSEKVLLIYKDNRLLREIASDYGVNMSTIYDIKHGRTWRETINA
jgi:hypothetical protein